MQKYTITVIKNVKEKWEVEALNTIDARILYENGKATKVSNISENEIIETKPSNA